MLYNTISSYNLGTTTVLYIQDTVSNNIGLTIIPTDKLSQIKSKRENLNGNFEVDVLPFGTIRADFVEPLVLVKIMGSEQPGGFSQGRTMRPITSEPLLTYISQKTSEKSDIFEIKTILEHKSGLEFEHNLIYDSKYDFINTFVLVSNTTSKIQSIEMISSFCLAGISPFDESDSNENLILHRIRGAWSAEGRLESVPIEQLNLERSWTGHGARCERFGQIGSMPCNGFFPFIGIEDKKAGVCWGAMLHWAGSWQMEAYRRVDSISISGGLADREFGHWFKHLKPKETFKTPVATIAAVSGGIDFLCHNLIKSQKRALEKRPISERQEPIAFNEWCTSWGSPCQQSCEDIAQKLKNTDTKYLVIDAGWYEEEGRPWYLCHGNWNPSSKLFSNGLKSAADKIREAGLIPGIWFEFETVGPQSIDTEFEKHLLTRDGYVINSGGRRFWDFRDPFTFDYLTNKVIDLIKECQFGYLKIDYNETIGFGVDGAESPGEAFRQHIEKVYEFLHKIKSECPELVIENCSSGGHRLEPSMMQLCDLGSFSDAHETLEIPIIAANLHRVILPQQSLVWAVLRKNDTLKRISYSLCAAFLGRMCLSGDILDLNQEQLKMLKKAELFYGKVKHIISNGQSFRYGTNILSYRKPKGWQVIARVNGNKNEMLIVCHSFENKDIEDIKNIKIKLPESGNWTIEETYGHIDNNKQSIINGDNLIVSFDSSWDSFSLYIKKKQLF